MDVSIIIVNYNTCLLTKNCIESIFKKTVGVSYEIILVDNASTDDSFNVFSKDNKIKYIYSQENLGFGRANNLGLEKANGDYILFLNSDTILINDAISILYSYINEHPECGAVGGNLYDIKGLPIFSFQRTFPTISKDLFPHIYRLISRIKYKNNSVHNFTMEPMSVCHISGADLMVRKKVLDKIGSFNPKFFMYYEETELCHRIYSSGLQLVSVPDAKISHLVGKSGSIGRSSIWQAESRYIYFDLVGKSGLYSRLDAFCKFCYTQLLIIKYCGNDQIVSVLKSCQQIYKNIFLHNNI